MQSGSSVVHSLEVRSSQFGVRKVFVVRVVRVVRDSWFVGLQFCIGLVMLWFVGHRTGSLPQPVTSTQRFQLRCTGHTSWFDVRANFHSDGFHFLDSRQKFRAATAF